jgi:hypothetical protein
VLIQQPVLTPWENMGYAGRKSEVVTDDNMIIEFRYDKSLIL